MSRKLFVLAFGFFYAIPDKSFPCARSSSVARPPSRYKMGSFKLIGDVYCRKTQLGLYWLFTVTYSEMVSQSAMYNAADMTRHSPIDTLLLPYNDSK